MENFEEQLDLFEDTLPPETDEKGCDSFDNLVYITPSENVSIPLDKLSEEQKIFLISRLDWDKDWFYINTDINHFHYIHEAKKWFTEAGEIGNEEKVVCFNDIFIQMIWRFDEFL